jgi:TM2 domain-containing membrane protein YozV
MKSRTGAIVRCLLLGGLGWHWYYLRKKDRAWMYLLFCWTCIPLCLSILDFIRLAMMSRTKFDRKYNYRYGNRGTVHNHFY